MSIDRTKLRWNGYGWAAHKDALAGRDEVWVWLATQLGMPALLATPARDLSDITLPASRLSDGELQSLTQIVGAERLRSDDFERVFHARARNYPGLLSLRAGELGNVADVIVYPRSANEVVALLAFASDKDIAVTSWGGGSLGVNGPGKRFLAIDMSGLERVSELNGDVATFDAGISGPALEKTLQAKGRTLGHSIEAFEFSTLGGWIAKGDTGTAALRYGAPRDWLVSATIATPCGLLNADSTGLRDLVVGSQGSLGLVTHASIRTKALPQAKETRGFLFRDFAGAQNAMRQALDDELPLSSLILSDGEETGFWRAFESLGQRRGLGSRMAGLFRNTRGFDDKATSLSVTFEGPARNLNDAISHFEKIAAKAGATALDGGGMIRKMPLGYFRDSLLDHGVGLETFRFETDWSNLSALHTALTAALETTFAGNPPCPGAKGIALTNVAALPNGKTQLTLTYVFPRSLGAESEQWEFLRKAVDQATGSGATNPLNTEIIETIRRTLDPKGTLPAN